MKLEDLKLITDHFRLTPSPENYADLQTFLREKGLDPDNLYQELEMSDRFVQVHQDSSYSNQILQLHSHDFYEILCCRNTCGAEYLVGSERYRLQKGDIIFVPPGTGHRPLLPEGMEVPYVRDVLWFSEEFVQLLRRQYGRQGEQTAVYSSLLRTVGTRWEYLGGMLREAVKEGERRLPCWESAVVGSSMVFLSHLKRAFLDQGASVVAAERPDLLGRVMAYMEDNLSEKMTLADVARRFYVSESTIRQTFRKKMGVSFYRCVTQRRLITAKQLIGQGQVLEHVAARTGFADYSSFYRAFKKEYGISPRQYRALQEQAGKPWN